MQLTLGKPRIEQYNARNPTHTCGHCNTPLKILRWRIVGALIKLGFCSETCAKLHELERVSIAARHSH